MRCQKEGEKSDTFSLKVMFPGGLFKRVKVPTVNLRVIKRGTMLKKGCVHLPTVVFPSRQIKQTSSVHLGALSLLAFLLLLLCLCKKRQICTSLKMNSRQCHEENPNCNNRVSFNYLIFQCHRGCISFCSFMAVGSVVRGTSHEKPLYQLPARAAGTWQP